MLIKSGARMAPSVELIRSLLDLTQAEARLARDLTAGLSITEAAGAAGILTSTARTHLKRIFAKTGFSRQSELVGLLSRLAFPVGDPP